MCTQGPERAGVGGGGRFAQRLAEEGIPPWHRPHALNLHSQSCWGSWTPRGTGPAHTQGCRPLVLRVTRGHWWAVRGPQMLGSCDQHPRAPPTHWQRVLCFWRCLLPRRQKALKATVEWLLPSTRTPLHPPRQPPQWQQAEPGSHASPSGAWPGLGPCSPSPLYCSHGAQGQQQLLPSLYLPPPSTAQGEGRGGGAMPVHQHLIYKQSKRLNNAHPTN